MTTAPALNGQIIGQAERATRAVLDELLAETGTEFVEWVTLNVITDNGGRMATDTLVERLRSGLRLGDAPIREAIDALLSEGLLDEADAHLATTAAGDVRFREVRFGIDRITANLYGDLPADELAIAGKILTIITERANATLAS